MTENDNLKPDTNDMSAAAEAADTPAAPAAASSGPQASGAGAAKTDEASARTEDAAKRAQQKSAESLGSTREFSVPTRADADKDAEAEQSVKLPWYKQPFFRKIGYALIALIISVTVWGYVLMSENPTRTKRIENVRLSIDGGSEAGLRSRNLIISDDLASILPTVTVNVETRLNELSRFDSALGSVVTASIDLNDIRSPGVYERQISALSTIGTPISVEPSSVTITVENYVTRTVPVTYSFIGELPEGYWHGDPTLTLTGISLPGAESKISSIVKANCVIDLTDRTEDIYESFEPLLLDDAQNVLDKTGVVGVVPAVTVRMSILPKKEIDLSGMLEQTGEINENYEIASVSVSPPTLNVAAAQSVLDSLESSLYFEPINVSNLRPGTHTQRISVMGITNDMTLLNDNQFFVTIEVVDKTVQRSFGIPIDELEVSGEKTELYNYQYNTHSFDVRLEGPARIVNAIKQGELKLSLDVAALTSGTYTLTPVLSAEGDPEWLRDGSVSITIQSVVCTVVLHSPTPTP